MAHGKAPETNRVSSTNYKLAFYEFQNYTDKKKSYEETVQAHLTKLRKEADREDLQNRLRSIEVIAQREGWTVEQLAERKRAAIRENEEFERQLESQAHLRAMDSLKKRFETQNISVRLEAAREMKNAQAAHVERLQQTRKELEEKRRQLNEEGASAAEKRAVTAQIKKITKEEEAEKKKIAQWEEQEAYYAKVKAAAEFQRASAAKKVELTNQQITKLKEEQEKIESELTERIQARKIDLAVELEKPEDKQDKEKIEQLTREIGQLEEHLEKTSETYETATNKLSDSLISLEFEQAHEEAIKKLEVTLKTSAKDVARQKVDATKQKTAEARLDREARHEYGRSEEGKEAEADRFAQEFEENATDKALVQTLENLGNLVNAK